MPKNFISPHGGHSITEAQYIVELILSKWAKWKKIDISGKFWKREPFKSEWPKQSVLAARLLKIYPAAAIIRAISSPLSDRIFSLGNKSLISIIEKFVAESQISKPTTDVTSTESKPRNESCGNKSIVSILENLE